MVIYGSVHEKQVPIKLPVKFSTTLDNPAPDRISKIPMILIIVLYSTMLLSLGAFAIFTSGFIKSPTVVLDKLLGNIYDDTSSEFELFSKAFVHLGEFPFRYTCSIDVNGSDHTGITQSLGISPPLFWTNPPTNTQSFTVFMTTKAVENEMKFSWILFAIPSNVTSLTENTTIGMNTQKGIDGDFQHNGYSRPCSKGSGIRWYNFTVYALDEKMDDIIPLDKDGNFKSLTGPNMLFYVRPHIISKAEMSVWYRRY